MTPPSHKHTEIKHAVHRLYATKPDWMKFYREVMGLGGIVRQAFESVEEMAEFEQTEIWREIHRMFAELRKTTPPKELAEDTKVITIRIPESMHEALRTEAFELRTTMNKLCISKLVQFVDSENVPTVFEAKKHLSRESKEAEVDL